MKERNHAFDFLCGLCILRMLLLHIISMCGFRSVYWFGKMMAWTFFFMSFFFFKAGYFNKTVSGNSLEYIKDKAKRLLIPYCVWGTIGNVVYFVFLYFCSEHFAKNISRLSWTHLYRYSHFYGDPPCWFLLSFFVAYVVVHFIEKGFSKFGHLLNERYGRRPKYVLMVLYFSLIVSLPFLSYVLWIHKNPMWLSFNNVFMGIFYFYLGHLWHKLQGLFSKKYIVVFSLLLILEFVIGNKLWHGEYDMSLNAFVWNPWGAGINTTCALCGISGLLLSLPMKRIPIINYIGEHSMVFFVAHFPLIYFYIFTHQAFGHLIGKRWDEFIIMSIFVVVICFMLVPFVEKTPWMSGRFKKKS